MVSVGWLLVGGEWLVVGDWWLVVRGWRMCELPSMSCEYTCFPRLSVGKNTSAFLFVIEKMLLSVLRVMWGKKTPFLVLWKRKLLSISHRL